VMEFIERMSTWTWETVVWPGHPWAEDKVVSSGLGGFHSVPLDPTLGLRELVAKRWPDVTTIPGRSSPRGQSWVAETTYFDAHAFDPSIRRHLYDVMTGEELSKTVDMFAMSYGVVHGNASSPGWWTPFPCLAALTGRIYIPHPAEGILMGEPYYVLPSAVEDIDDDAYASLASLQANRHEETAWTKNQLNTSLTTLLGSLVS